MTIMLASDVVVLGVVASPALVTTYTLAKYLPQAIIVAVATLIVAIMPGLGGMIGAGELTRAVRIRRETMSLIWLFTIVAGTTVLLWEASFLQLWVGGRYYPGSGAVLMIMLMVLQFGLIRTDANIIDLTLNLRMKVLLGAISAVASVGPRLALRRPDGLGHHRAGPRIHRGSNDPEHRLPLDDRQIVGDPPERQLRGIVRPAIATGVFFGGAGALADSLHAGSWVALVLSVGLSVAILAPVVFLAGLQPEIRRLLWLRLRRVARLT